VTGILKQAGREYAHNINTLQSIFRDAPSNERISATLAGIVAALAVALALIGVYALLAYNVARRTREIGVRVALGAGRRVIITMIVREGLLVTLLGVALGAPAAVAASTVLRSLLFGLSPGNPVVLLLVGAAFIALGAVAGLVPALRAANVPPAMALRQN
jgi:ABC-type antimicrobial peptide transport system permease subunit